MAYKSILTVVTDPTHSSAQIETAIALARREDAHLDVLCIGVDATLTGYYYDAAGATISQIAYDEARAVANKTEEAVRQRLAREDIRWSVESNVAIIGAVGGVIAQYARFSDLVILHKPYGPHGNQATETILEACLFEAGAPVLVVPQAEPSVEYGKRIILAWNRSNEALRAMRAALPMLKAASLVDITVIDPPAHGLERSDPGGLLSQLLARHGVRAEVSVLARTLPHTSEILCRHARDINADMVVMGAYGHSRFREAILGGSTRNMLEAADLPVFMAH